MRASLLKLPSASGRLGAGTPRVILPLVSRQILLLLGTSSHFHIFWSLSDLFVARTFALKNC